MLPLLVLMPLAAGVVAAILPARARPALTLVAAGLTTVAVALVALSVVHDGVLRVELAGWPAPLGIGLVADGASVLMLLLSCIVVMAVAIVGAVDERLIGTASFWPLLGAASAAVNGVFVAGDLFTVYVLLELLTISAVALVALGSPAPALRYLLVAVVGSLFYLLAVALVYGEAGTVDLALAAEVMVSGPVLSAVLILVAVGMAAKSALFPLHSWLPVAHPAAPTAVSALLSALVIKASLFVLWRVFAVLGPLSEATPVLAVIVGVAGCIGILWGGTLALRRRRLKTIIAYSTVAQVGYLVLLLALITSAGGFEQGWAGGILLAVAHGIAKAAMFLAAGALILAYGSDRIDGLRGAITRMPMAVAAFGIAGVSLAGLPPTLGFVGKWLLLQSSLTAGAWLWVAVLLLGALLTFAYTGRVIAATFNPPGEKVEPLPAVRPHAALSIVPFVLAVVSIALGLAPFGLVDLVQGAALTGGAQ